MEMEKGYALHQPILLRVAVRIEEVANVKGVRWRDAKKQRGNDPHLRSRKSCRITKDMMRIGRVAKDALGNCYVHALGIGGWSSGPKPTSDI